MARPTSEMSTLRCEDAETGIQLMNSRAGIHARLLGPEPLALYSASRVVGESRAQEEWDTLGPPLSSPLVRGALSTSCKHRGAA